MTAWTISSVDWACEGREQCLSELSLPAKSIWSQRKGLLLKGRQQVFSQIVFFSLT